MQSSTKPPVSKWKQSQQCVFVFMLQSTDPARNNNQHAWTGSSVTYAAHAPIDHKIRTLKPAMACSFHLLLLELLKKPTLNVLGSIQLVPVKPSSLLLLQKKKNEPQNRCRQDYFWSTL